MRLHKALDVADLQAMARRQVPRMFYDYTDTGSWTESTYHANEAELQKLHFRHRVGRDLSNCSTQAHMLDKDCAMPVALSPVGLAGMHRADGEILIARAAEKFSIPYTMSTLSICSVEDVAAATSAPFWFQLYILKDRDFMRALMQRVKDAGCSALVLTLDMQIMADRHRDKRNGLSTPPKPTLSTILNLLSKPRWCFNMLQTLPTGRYNFGNIVGHVKAVTNVTSFAEWINAQFDPGLQWDDLDWIKEEWVGPLILKGIMDPEDARIAVDKGADAIIVSNHGGRQLDGAPASIQALPAVVEAVDGRIPVWMDSGIRSGQDVLRALALGAQSTMIGRASIYGLGAGGEAGVTRALEIIQRELQLSMAMCGCSSPAEVDRSILASV